MRGARTIYCDPAVGLPVCSAEQLPIRSYTTADGLPNNRINRIVADSHGFIWFCTGEGLARFDGYGFTTYGVQDGLPHRSVFDLLETREGDYWVATGRGIARFRPDGGTGAAFDLPLIPSNLPLIPVLQTATCPSPSCIRTAEATSGPLLPMVFFDFALPITAQDGCSKTCMYPNRSAPATTSV